ncbi:MAG: phosphoglycolate phosphatase [Chromatiaceae bacterium]|jgi:phosphoglycolate phosphatase|nr:phosphoglycolate phosphatase [Chromatiaceae bacterium]
MPEPGGNGRPRRGGVLFDLDGTFADTAPDMALALNRLLATRGRAPLPFDRIRPQVSHGSRAMIQLGFGLGPEDARYESLRRQFLDLYAEDLASATVPFPGVLDLVTELEGQGIPWGIVTNKPGWLTDPLMAALGLAARPACVISGDTAARPKPHPDPLLLACERIGRAPADCWYLGDAERDVAAGRAAGTGTLVALFGYLGTGEDPATWGADGMIGAPLDLLGWLGDASG